MFHCAVTSKIEPDGTTDNDVLYRGVKGSILLTFYNLFIRLPVELGASIDQCLTKCLYVLDQYALHENKALLNYVIHSA